MSTTENAAMPCTVDASLVANVSKVGGKRKGGREKGKAVGSRDDGGDRTDGVGSA